MLLIQSKAPGKIADVRPQHNTGEQVRTAGHELPLEVPTVDTTIASIARASNDVVILGLLDGNKFGDKFGLYASEKVDARKGRVDYVVGEIGIHNDDKIARHKLEPVHIGSSQAELARARLEDDVVGAVYGD